MMIEVAGVVQEEWKCIVGVELIVVGNLKVGGQIQDFAEVGFVKIATVHGVGKEFVAGNLQTVVENQRDAEQEGHWIHLQTSELHPQ